MGISDEMVKRIKSSKNRVVLADEFVDQARRLFEGSKVNLDMERITAFLAIQRNDYTSTADLYGTSKSSTSNCTLLVLRSHPIWLCSCF